MSNAVMARKSASVDDVVVGIVIEDPDALSATVELLANHYQETGTTIPTVVFYQATLNDQDTEIVSFAMNEAINNAREKGFTTMRYVELSDGLNYTGGLAANESNPYFITDTPKAFADAQLVSSGRVVKVYNPEEVTNLFADLTSVMQQNQWAMTRQDQVRKPSAFPLFTTPYDPKDYDHRNEGFDTIRMKNSGIF